MPGAQSDIFWLLKLTEKRLSQAKILRGGLELQNTLLKRYKDIKILVFAIILKFGLVPKVKDL